MEKDEYMKRLLEHRKKKEVRRKKKYLGDNYCKMYPAVMTCRIHGKRRKERFMDCLHKLQMEFPDETDKRILEAQWHGIIADRYQYMENHWVWVLDVKYIPVCK